MSGCLRASRSADRRFCAGRPVAESGGAGVVDAAVCGARAVAAPFVFELRLDAGARMEPHGGCRSRRTWWA